MPSEYLRQRGKEEGDARGNEDKREPAPSNNLGHPMGNVPLAAAFIRITLQDCSASFADINLWRRGLFYTQGDAPILQWPFSSSSLVSKAPRSPVSWLLPRCTPPLCRPHSRAPSCSWQGLSSRPAPSRPEGRARPCLLPSWWPSWPQCSARPSAGAPSCGLSVPARGPSDGCRAAVSKGPQGQHQGRWLPADRGQA